MISRQKWHEAKERIISLARGYLTVAYMGGVNGRLVVRALIGTPKISCIDIKIRLIV